MILKLPPFKMLKGERGEHEVNIGGDIFITVDDTTPVWQDAEYNWTRRFVKKRKDYPVCWSADSIARFLDKFPSTAFSTLFAPKASFAKPGTLLRKPRCLIFCNYAMALGYTDVVNKFREQFEKNNISVYKVANRWPSFSFNGLPIASVEFEDGFPSNGKEIPTLLTGDRFIGGEVMIVSDIDTNYQGTYSEVNFHPYYSEDNSEIADCVTGFKKIKNFVYSFAEDGFEDFFDKIADSTEEPEDYFVVHQYTVTVSELVSSLAKYNLAKDDLFTDIADFFGLQVP